MATESLNNMFSGFGPIVSGERFVGRKAALTKISQRVLGKTYGNLAIMGLPRIGKSSLAWQSIMTKKKTLLEERTIPIFFSTGSCREITFFFQQMVLSLDQEIGLSFFDGKYIKFTSGLVEAIKSANADDASFTLNIINYYKVVKRLGYKVIYILDEFDGVQQYFDLAAFQLLRELSYNPEIKLCLVTTSRKTIQEIESKNGAISNFYGTFQDLRLGMFDDDDMTEYWHRVDSYKFTDGYKNGVEYYVGRHPLLLDLLNDYFVRSGELSLDNAADDVLNDIRIELWYQFKSILNTLSNEKLLDKAIQLILGPVYDVTRIQEEKLLKYEFIKIVENAEKTELLGRIVGAQPKQGLSYVCFSDYFTLLFDQEFISNIDYWPLWSDTEKKMRELIKIYISETYSSDWETEIFAQYGGSENWAKRFNLLKSTRNTNIRLFPGASSNLIDYTLTSDMYETFMSKAWKDWFCHVFPGRQKDWAAKFVFLAAVRNPMAHNNREFISKEQIREATDYCNEIVRIITEWEAKQQ